MRAPIEERLRKLSGSTTPLDEPCPLWEAADTIKALLEALKGLYEACELRANADGGDFGEDIGPAAYLAEAAIAKAEGAQ